MMKFIHLLQKPASQRTKEDIDALFRWLCPHKAFLSLSEADLRSICRNIRYEKHPANALLFRRHELIRSWYILLSGSVFIDERMYIADDSFGKRRIGGGGIGGGRGGGDPSPSDSIIVVGEFYRTSECIVSEPSEMIVIDYLGVSSLELDQLDEDCVDGVDDDDEDEEDEEGEVEMSGYSGTIVPLPVLYSQNRHLRYSDSSLFDQNFLDCEATQRGTLRQSDRSMDRCYVGGGGGGSRASDTSSLCSGSDMMMSSTEDQPIDLTGLIESIVDSDDDDDFQRNGEREEEDEEELRSMHDAFRETLEKLPAERTDRDIGLILENIQHLPAFNNMTLATRQALCGVMRYAAIDAKDTVVMTDGEQLDSWSVILNGEVETIHPSGEVKVLKQGESFGFTAPTAEKVYHEGLMHTKVNNCQFICISQDDYCRIMQQGAENIESVKENNQVVLVTEERVFDDRKARVVIRGTPEKLLDQLMLRLSSVDPTYTDDFLLTYRTFFKSPLPVAQKLLKWLDNSSYRDQVVTIVLDWVNSHYSDFETEPRMMDLLEQLERNLEELNLNQQLKMLRMTCAFKAKPRTVILNRTEKKEVLHFNVLGGLERGCGIYVSQVERGSKADEIGLKRGDQILEVNNQNFERISHNRALEILRGSTHLSITVKSNLLGFKEMVSTPSVSGSGSRKESKGHPRKQPLGQIMSADAKFGSAKSRQRPPVIRGNKEDERASFLSGGNKSKLRQALMKLNILPRSSIMNSGGGGLSVSQAASRKGSTSGGSSPLIRTRFSSSHPDLSTLKLCPADDVSSFPDHVLKIFQDDQSFKFLLVFKETTAREVVMLALQEFGITTPASSKYSLCEVTVLEEGFVKQRRLPDQLSNLADRCALNSRYYLKWNDRTDPLIPDDIIGDVLRECQTHFLLLDCAETAAQLTIKDFQIFRDIHPTEYVIDLFRSPSNYGTPNLTKFSQLSNSEMFWVATQICSETNLNRRTKTMKHFIQIAKHCQECKNFNSLFAIISGLGHGSVQRLKQTWDKLPSKYLRLFEDLQKLMDPSRNMSRYRNLINSETSHPPLIPFFPLVKKDLTFIHLGNDSLVDGLVNFEKLRMIAKEVRHICNMAPAYSDVNISINASAAALMRKKLSGTMQTNPRKIYEETQMVRRVRAYLTTYKTIEDEAVLADMSNQCEPSVAFGFLARKQEAGGCTNNHPVTLTKQTTTTAAIGIGPKFGADSPDAVHKLLQLTDRVRPLDNRKQQQQQRHQHHVLSTVTLSGGSGGGQQTVKPGCLSANNQAMTLTTTHSTSSSSNSSSSSVLLLSPESSSVLGPNQTTGPERRPTIAAKDRMAVGGGSASNSPTSSIGSGAGRRLVQQGTNNYRPKRSESDSGHNSSSNCDSNSTSSVGSTGSPSLTKPRPRVSSMRQTSTQSFGRSSATTAAAAAAAADGGTLKQQSRSIFYVSSMSDLSQSSKTTAGQSSRAYCAPTVSGQNSSRPKVATKDSEVKERSSEVKERSSVRSRDSEATSLKEEEDEEEEEDVRRGRRTTTHRRTSSSPLRPPGQVLHQHQQQQQQHPGDEESV